MGNRTFRILCEQRCDTVAAPEPQPTQGIRPLVGVVVNLLEGIAMNLLGPVFVNQRQALRVSGPTVADVVGDVVVERDVPLEIAIDLFVGITTLEQVRHGWSPLAYLLGY